MSELEQQVLELEQEVGLGGPAGCGGQGALRRRAVKHIAGGGERSWLLRPAPLRSPVGFFQNQNLLLENQLLREKTQGLAVQNQELRYRLGLDAPETEEERAPEVSVCPNPTQGTGR